MSAHRRLLTAPMLLSFTAIAGCANLTFEEISTTTDQAGNVIGTTTADVGGITYYRPAPYLKVDAGAQGGCVGTLVWLPDYSKQYKITPHYWLGTVSLKPTLADGWNLTALDSTVDTKIPETITAITGGIANLENAAKPAAVGQEEPPKPGGFNSFNPRTGKEELTGPGLYRIELSGYFSPPEAKAVPSTAKLVQVEVLRENDAARTALLCPGLKSAPPAPTQKPTS
jgi:hypothetical protein